MDCSLPGSCPWDFPVIPIILQWVAISFSRGSSQSKDRTCIFCIGRQILYHQGSPSDLRRAGRDPHWGKATWAYYEKCLQARKRGSSGRGSSSRTEPASTLILDFAVSKIVRNKYLLFKPPYLWYFVREAWAKREVKGHNAYNLLSTGSGKKVCVCVCVCVCTEREKIIGNFLHEPFVSQQQL